MRRLLFCLVSVTAPLAVLLVAPDIQAQDDAADSSLESRVCSNAPQRENERSSNYEEDDGNTIYVVKNLGVTNRLGRVVLVNCLPDAEVRWVEAEADVQGGARTVRLPHRTVEYEDDPQTYRLLDFNPADPLRNRIWQDIEWRLQRDPRLPQTCNFLVRVGVEYTDGRLATLESYHNPCILRLLTLKRLDIETASGGSL